MSRGIRGAIAFAAATSFGLSVSLALVGLCLIIALPYPLLPAGWGPERFPIGSAALILGVFGSVVGAGTAIVSAREVRP